MFESTYCRIWEIVAWCLFDWFDTSTIKSVWFGIRKRLGEILIYPTKLTLFHVCYKISNSELGKGAFGQIFDGSWSHNGHKESVAIKKLMLDLDSPDGTQSFDIFFSFCWSRFDLIVLTELIQTFREFQREVFVMTKIIHPCVINIKSFSFDPLCLVIEKAHEGGIDFFFFL